MPGAYTKEVKILNQKLIDKYGYNFDYPMFRIVWGDDEFEKRWTEYDHRGNKLVNPEVRELPKYRQWDGGKYILERVTVVPHGILQNDLTEKMSYEPIYTFMGKNKEFLPPIWPMCLMIIYSYLKNLEPSYYPKYKQTEEDIRRMDKAEFDRTYEALFGNDTDISDALAVKDGISMSGAYKNGENASN